MSGLQPSVEKSLCFFAGTPNVMQRKIANMMGYRIGELPVKYLGMPLITTRLTKRDCNPLLETTRNKIKNWAAKPLSFIGQLTLIKANLVSTQVYWCSLFILPRSVYKVIGGLFRNFLWSGTFDNHKKAKVAWEEVTKLFAE